MATIYHPSAYGLSFVKVKPQAISNGKDESVSILVCFRTLFLSGYSPDGVHVEFIGEACREGDWALGGGGYQAEV